MILKKVKQTLQNHGLVRNGDRIVVGVSGGPDSVTLLCILKSLSKEFKLNLFVAHLDHMIRHDSYEDAEFVVKLAKKLNLPIFTARVNVRKLADKGSIEEIARNARFEFFFKVAKKVKADKIALGHNLDDQAETVLMRILRGTGLYGLAGILPKRMICGFQIIRPLIEVRRRDIQSYLNRRGIRARLDLTNREEVYFRNRIRNELIPMLEKKYNKNIKEILANMAQTAGSDYDYLICASGRVSKRLKNRIQIDKLARLHPSIRRLILRSLYSGLKGDTRRLTYQHIREIEDLALVRPVNSIVDLPKGISVKKSKKSLRFYRRKT